LSRCMKFTPSCGVSLARRASQLFVITEPPIGPTMNAD
jgi:hypothetical protein